MAAIEAAHMAQLDPLQLSLEPLARIQLRRIGGQPLDLEAGHRALGQERCDDVTAVNRSPIPDDHHTARHLTEPMRQKRDDVFRGDGAVLAMEIPLSVWGQGADRREMVVCPPFSQEGCLAHGRMGADAARQGIEAGFV